MTQKCESLATKQDLQRYATQPDVKAAIALAIAQLVNSLNLGGLVRKVAVVESKTQKLTGDVLDAKKKALEASFDAADATRSATNAGGKATQAIGKASSALDKAFDTANKYAGIISALASIYAILQNMVDAQRFQALEQGFRLLEQNFAADQASKERILTELRNRTNQSAAMAAAASRQALWAQGRADGAFARLDGMQEQINSQYGGLNNRIATVSSESRAYGDKITKIESSLGTFATQQQIRELEAQISNLKNSGVGKNYDSQIAVLEKALAEANKNIGKANEEIAKANQQIGDLAKEIGKLQPKIIGAPTPLHWDELTWQYWDWKNQRWVKVPLGTTPSGVGAPSGAGFNPNPYGSPNVVGGGSGGASPSVTPATKQDVATIADGIKQNDSRIKAIENGLTGLGNKVDGVINTLPNAPIITPSVLPNFQPQLDTLNQRTTLLETRIGQMPQIDTGALARQMAEFNQGIRQIPNQVSGIVNSQLQPIRNQTSPSAISNATAAGVCRTSQPGGCLGDQFDNTNRRIDTSMAGVGDLINRILGMLNLLFGILSNLSLAGITAQLTRIEGQNVETHTRLGARIVGGISGWASRINRQLGLERWLNLLNTAATFHNAAMLSNGAFQSLTYVIDNILNVAGFQFQDAEGADMTFSSVVSSTVESVVRSVVGDETYEEVKARWTAWSRIVQTASNLYNNVRNIFDTTREMFETVTENTGRVGNALKRFLVVPDIAYPWMSERVTANNRITRAIDNYVKGASATREVFDALSEVTEGVIEIQETAQEIKENKEAGVKAIEDFRKEVDDKEAQISEDSKPPKIDFNDLIKKEPDNE